MNDTLGKIAIEKNVPIPPRRPMQIPWTAFPFEDMRPGDSFLVPCERDKPTRHSRMSSLNTALRRYRKNRPDRVFTCRSVDGGIRCWRVS